MAKKTYLEDPDLYKKYGIDISQAAKWDRLISSDEFRSSEVRGREDFYKWASQNGISDPDDYWQSARENYNMYYQIYESSDQPEPEYSQDQGTRRRKYDWALRTHSTGNPQASKQARLEHGAKSWENMLAKAEELERADTNYRGPKLANIKSIVEYQRWIAHFSPVLTKKGEENLYSLDDWLNSKYHKAHTWQKVLADKKLGLDKITNKEEFLRLRQTNSLAAKLPEDYWDKTHEIREAHREWDRASEYDDFKKKFADTNTDLKKKDYERWKKDLINVGIDHITTEEEFIAWRKASSQRKNISVDVWKQKRALRSSYETFFKPALVEIEEETAATEAQRIEKAQIDTPHPDRPESDRQDEQSARTNIAPVGETGAETVSAADVSQLVNEMSEEERARATAAVVTERNPQPFPQVSMNEPDFGDANAQQMQNQQANDTLQRQEEEQQQEQQGPGRPSRPALRQAPKLLNRIRGTASSGGIIATITGSGGGTILLVVLGVVLVVVFIIIFFVVLLSGHADDKILLHIEKKGPDAVEVTQNMEYQIATSYNDKDDVLITDLIPDNAEFVSAGGIYEKLDASGKPTTNNPDVKKVTWTIKGTTTNQTDNKFDEEKFKQMGFPAPSSPVSPLTQVEQENWYKNSLEWAQKAAQLQGIDIGLLGAIARIQTNNNSHPFSPFVELCNNKEQDVNKPCDNASWQVGYGVKPAEVSVNRLQEAIDKMYAGGSVNIASLGNEIIQRSKTRDGGAYELKNITFPADITLETLFTGANQGNADQKKMWGILMKDDAISMYLLSAAIKDITSRQGKTVAENLEAVNSTDFKRQNVIDSVKAIYDDGFKPVLNNPQGAKDFTITLKPKVNDSYVINKANIVITNAGKSSTGSGTQPNADNCNGKYSLDNTLKKNFGDPNCNFTTDGLITQLKSQDPTYADLWYLIAKCESNWDPNAFRPHSKVPQTPDPEGAWGLFQMGTALSGTKPGEGRNGPYDRGDVDWPQQISNAIMFYRNVLAPAGAAIGDYWACEEIVTSQQ